MCNGSKISVMIFAKMHSKVTEVHNLIPFHKESIGS